MNPARSSAAITARSVTHDTRHRRSEVLSDPRHRSQGHHPERHYDRVSDAWRLLMGENFHYGYFPSERVGLNEATEMLSAILADRAQIQGRHRVLDVGCGIGGPATYLATTRHCRVTGISTSPRGIATARSRAKLLGLVEHLHFLVRDGMANRFDDASFDRVWVMESAHLMPDKERLLAECARVLQPGGRLVLCDIIFHREPSLHEVLGRKSEFDLLRRAFGRAKLATFDQYADAAEAAGLVVDETLDLSEEALPTLTHWQQNARRHRARVIPLIGDRAHADFVASCDCLRSLWREGLVGYGLVTATRPG